MSQKKTMNLEPGTTYIVPVHDGHLEIDVSPDESNPGVDIEFVSDHETEQTSQKVVTRPRIVIETDDETRQLRTAMWSNPHREDYSHILTFRDVHKDAQQGG